MEKEQTIRKPSESSHFGGKKSYRSNFDEPFEFDQIKTKLLRAEINVEKLSIREPLIESFGDLLKTSPTLLSLHSKMVDTIKNCEDVEKSINESSVILKNLKNSASLLHHNEDKNLTEVISSRKKDTKTIATQLREMQKQMYQFEQRFNLDMQELDTKITGELARMSSEYASQWEGSKDYILAGLSVKQKAISRSVELLSTEIKTLQSSLPANTREMGSSPQSPEERKREAHILKVLSQELERLKAACVNSPKGKGTSINLLKEDLNALEKEMQPIRTPSLGSIEKLNEAINTLKKSKEQFSDKYSEASQALNTVDLEIGDFEIKLIDNIVNLNFPSEEGIGKFAFETETFFTQQQEKLQSIEEEYNKIIAPISECLIEIKEFIEKFSDTSSDSKVFKDVLLEKNKMEAKILNANNFLFSKKTAMLKRLNGAQAILEASGQGEQEEENEIEIQDQESDNES